MKNGFHDFDNITTSLTVDLSPNIVTVPERFNKFSFWTRNCFVNERDLKRRQALMVKFVAIARELREMKNYASLFQITSALNSADVNRSKSTEGSVGRQGRGILGGSRHARQQLHGTEK